MTSPYAYVPEEELAQSGALTGPWVEAFWFSIPFPLRSKSNFRRTRKHSAADRATWKAYQEFESSVALLSRLSLPPTWEVGEESSSVSERPAVAAWIFGYTTLDAANLSKSILDACEGSVFITDASVRHCASMSERTRTQSGGLAAFARLAPDASLTDLVAASSSLAEQTLPLL